MRKNSWFNAAHKITRQITLMNELMIINLDIPMNERFGFAPPASHYVIDLLGLMSEIHYASVDIEARVRSKREKPQSEESIPTYVTHWETCRTLGVFSLVTVL